MWSLPAVWLLAGIALPAHADPVTFSIGDLNQYQLPSVPQLDGNVVTYSGNADGGIDVVFSAGLKDKIKAASVEECKSLTDACLQSMANVLRADGVVDSRGLETRQLQIAGAVIVAVLSNIILTGIQLFSPDYEPFGHRIPAQKIDPALATASEIAVVTEDGKPAVTISQALSTPTAIGPDVPVVSVVTSASEGQEKGEVIITLPEEVAKRADEIIARLLTCSTADVVPAGKRDIEMRAGDILQDAICGGRAIYSNADVQGTLAQLDLIQMPNINLRDPALVAALGQFIAWARANGAHVRLPARQVDSVAVAAFILGLIRASGNTLQRINVLRANYVNADMPITAMPPENPTATTASACGSCTVSCSLRGVIEFCRTGCPSCGAKPTLYTTITTEDWAWPTALPEESDVAPVNQCDGDISDLPWGVFKDIPGKFCAEVDKNPTKALEWVVNSRGDQTPKLGARGDDGHRAPALVQSRGMEKRAPPPNPDTYKDFRVTLKWAPRDGEQDYCALSCSETYSQLQGGPCNPTGSVGQTMKVDASTDNMCGIYSYHIDAPPKSSDGGGGTTKVPLSLSDQKCHDKPEHHGDVSWKDQEGWAQWLCGQSGIEDIMKAGDKPITWTPTQSSRDAFLTYTISWVEGCTTDVDGQSVRLPVDGTTCFKLLRENFTECKSNEGVGGWRQAGCLKYEFLGHGGG